MTEEVSAPYFQLRWYHWSGHGVKERGTHNKCALPYPPDVVFQRLHDPFLFLLFWRPRFFFYSHYFSFLCPLLMLYRCCYLSSPTLFLSLSLKQMKTGRQTDEKCNVLIIFPHRRLTSSVLASSNPSDSYNGCDNNYSEVLLCKCTVHFKINIFIALREARWLKSVLIYNSYLLIIIINVRHFKTCVLAVNPL